MSSEKKVCVNYDEVIRTLDFWAKVNRHPLKEIEWVRDNGDTIVFDERLVDAWRFVGLSNVYFAQDILTGVIAGEEQQLLDEFSDLAVIQRREDQK
mgnify:CR=1 FL=1